MKTKSHLEATTSNRITLIVTCNSEESSQMSNRNKLENAFRIGLELREDQDVADLEYRQITEWDSIGHMALIAEIEDAFNVVLPTDDVIGISSFSKSIEILSKHGVTDLE